MVQQQVADGLFLKSVVALSIALVSQSASAECSYADASIYNGWGWDQIAGVSCPPLDACDYTDADIHGGWGWNAGTLASCPPLVPTIGDCIDSDGDGWGWDGVESCLVDDLPPSEDQLIFVDIPGQATAYGYLLSADEASAFFYYAGDDLYIGDTGNADVFVMDNNSGAVNLLTLGEGGVKANNDSYLEDVSEDGNTVLFRSGATNFANSSANGVSQPYLLDVATGVTTQVLDSSPWSYVNSVLSDDGNYVAFSTAAGNIVAGDRNNTSDVFLFDVNSRITTRVSLTQSGEELTGTARIRDISADGRYVLFIYEADANGGPWQTGLYVYDRLLQSNKAIRYLDGGYHPAGLSADGVIVAHQYWQGRSRSVGWVNTQTGESGTIDPPTTGSSGSPSVSPDGKFVAYRSSKANLVNNVTVSGVQQQIYVTELSTGTTVLVSQSPDGQVANGFNSSPVFVAGGKYIHFTSEATNLHSEDTDTNADVYLFEMPAQ